MEGIMERRESRREGRGEKGMETREEGRYIREGKREALF